MLRIFPAVLVVALASPAGAQVIHRDPPAAKKPADDKKPDDKKADDKADEDKAGDDDILAPEGAEKATGPVEQKPKAYSVGLVAIVPVGEAGKTAADTATTGLLKELGAGHVFATAPLAVDVGGGAGAPDQAAAQAALKDAKAAFDKGHLALDKLKMGIAKKAFASALASYEKAAPVLKDATQLFDCHVFLAEVAAREGRDADADVELTAAAALDPERNLDTKRYPGAFITSYEKARDKLLKKAKDGGPGRGSIVVDPSGAGASVEVDGRATAGAPVTVNEVPVGRHLVRALREGLPGYGTIVEVKAGETVTVSPGFIAQNGNSYVDDLQNNRLTPAAAKAVAAAAKAASLKGAVVGVVNKTATGSEVQLVLVDAGGAGMKELPALEFTGDMLDIGIETLKARDAIEAAFDKPAFETAAIDTLVEGATASAARMATFAMRFDVQALKAPSRSRLVTDEGEGRAKVLAAGKSGTRARLDDDEDPYAIHDDNSKAAVPDPDAPMTDQAWFWPTVIGGGAGALVVLGGAAYASLVAAKVVPDPRPAGGAQIHVALP